MALTRGKKEEIVQKVSEIFRSTSSMVFVNFHGLSVADANEMRKALREKSLGYTVAKKTLIKRVLDSASFEGERPSLEGELAVAYVSLGGDADVIAPAKEIVSFQKQFEGRIIPLGGVLESKYITKEEVIALSKIPSRKALYSQFAMVLNSPIQQTVGVLSGVMRSFAVVIGQIAEQKS